MFWSGGWCRSSKMEDSDADARSRSSKRASGLMLMLKISGFWLQHAHVFRMLKLEAEAQKPIFKMLKLKANAQTRITNPFFDSKLLNKAVNKMRLKRTTRLRSQSSIFFIQIITDFLSFFLESDFLKRALSHKN